MSGIEIVGLILGITPLIISAIEDYRAGLEPFKIWARYRKELKNLKMVLDLETAKLLNTCEMLLETVVSQSELAQLLREPNGPLWSDQSLHQKLEDTLGRSYAPFFSCLLEFDDALSELQEKLDKNRTSHRDRAFWECNIERLKYSISSEKRKQLKKTLEKSNKNLRTLIKSSQTLTNKPRKPGQRTDFEQVRKTACGVYAVLKTGPWHCLCPSPHNANLLLEPRMKAVNDVNQATSNGTLRFRFLFSFPTHNSSAQSMAWNWHETDIVPLGHESMHSTPQPSSSSNSARPNDTLGNTSSLASVTPVMGPPAKKQRKSVQWAHIDRSCLLPTPLSTSGHSDKCQTTTKTSVIEDITDLCAALQQVSEGAGCIGALSDREQRTYKFMAVRRHPDSQDMTNTVPLSQLLSSKFDSARMPGTLLATTRPFITGPDWRLLALTVASTALQLQRTPWLKERWGKDDIVFLRELSAERRPIISKPYISQSFSSANAVHPPKCSDSIHASSPVIRNKTLFDLGILLIELCFQQPMEAMHTKDDLDDDGKINQYTDLSTANRLVERVYETAGVRYGDAVRRCIHCDFDQREETFENEEFRQAVYQNVVMPLEDELRVFHGGQIPRNILDCL